MGSYSHIGPARNSGIPEDESKVTRHHDTTPDFSDKLCIGMGLPQRQGLGGAKLGSS